MKSYRPETIYYILYYATFPYSITDANNYEISNINLLNAMHFFCIRQPVTVLDIGQLNLAGIMQLHYK